MCLGGPESNRHHTVSPNTCLRSHSRYALCFFQLEYHVMLILEERYQTVIDPKIELSHIPDRQIQVHGGGKTQQRLGLHASSAFFYTTGEKSCHNAHSF